MARRGRPGMTRSQKAEVWRRWKKGESLSQIARALSKHAGSVYGILLVNGGVVRAPRKRSRLALTLNEREEISRGIARHSSIREIARLIGRSPSTVSRERSSSGSWTYSRPRLSSPRAH